MSERLYLISLSMLFGTVLAAFAIKYLSAAYQARSRSRDENAYRDLAATAVAARTAQEAAFSALAADLAEIRTKLTSIEKILKDVE